MSSRYNLTQLAMAYHVCPLEGYQWNLEKLAKYVDVFNGPKVVGLATLSKVNTEKVCDEIYSFLGTDTVIKKVVNNPIARESVTFPNMMRYLDLKIDKSKTAIWYGHTKGITHTDNKKFAQTTKLWAGACYHYTLSADYLSKSINALEMGYSIAGPFRRYSFQRNFPPQKFQFHYSGTFFWLNAYPFFSSHWKKLPVHRYAIEASPGMLFDPNDSYCTFGDRVKDLYKNAVWEKLIKSEKLRGELLK